MRTKNLGAKSAPRQIKKRSVKKTPDRTGRRSALQQATVPPIKNPIPAKQRQVTAHSRIIPGNQERNLVPFGALSGWLQQMYLLADHYAAHRQVG